MTPDQVFVGLSILASIVGYGGYYLALARGQARPHVFSWLNWGMMTTIGTYAEFKLNSGLMAWGLAFMALNYFAVAFWGFFVGEKNITRSDWASLSGAFLTMLLWKLTDSPMVAIFCLMAFDVFSYWPTVRKSWHDPWGEPLKTYAWAGLRYFFLLFTLPEFSPTALLYPFWLMSTDWGFMIYAVIRRRYKSGY